MVHQKLTVTVVLAVAVAVTLSLPIASAAETQSQSEAVCNAACNANSDCTDGSCPYCTPNPNGGGKQCTATSCGSPCQSQNDCDSTLCFECNAATGLCINPFIMCNATCASNKDCTPGDCQFCVPTPTGSQCSLNACGSACQSQADCADSSCYCTNGTCATYTCFDQCKTDSDCTGNPPQPVTCPFCLEGVCNFEPYPQCGFQCNAQTPCPTDRSVSPCTACVGGSCMDPIHCGQPCSGPADCGGECQYCTANGVCGDSSESCGAVCRSQTDCYQQGNCQSCYQATSKCVNTCGMPCATANDCWNEDGNCGLCIDSVCSADPYVPAPAAALAASPLRLTPSHSLLLVIVSCGQPCSGSCDNPHCSCEMRHDQGYYCLYNGH